MRVLVGGCVELGDIGLAYLPVVDALRGLADDPADAELLAEVAATAPGLGRLLPGSSRPARGRTGNDGLDQLQVFDAVRALLVGRAERSPVVLVLEDLHWADRASRDLVAFLARTLRSGRVMLVVSYRSDELHRRHPLRPLLAELVRLPGVERLELAPFSRAELAEHLEAIAGVPLPADQVEGIHTPGRRATRSTPSSCWPPAPAMRTSGCRRHSPMCCWLGSRGCLSRPSRCCGWRRWPAAGCPTGCSPRSPGSPRPTWSRACVRRSTPASWWPTAHRDTMRFAMRCCRRRSTPTCSQASRCGCMPPTPACSPAEPEGVAAELAHHCLASHDLVGALAASVRAAEEAAAVLAPAETLRHLSTALKLWERVPDPAAVTGTDRVDLLLRAAAAASAAGERQRAVAWPRRPPAADATADPVQAARAYERLGLYLLDAGRVEEALRARLEPSSSCPPSRPRGCGPG